MNKSSSTSVAKPPLRQSAWAKGPPPNTSTASSPRSQSPAPISPATPTVNAAPTHSRRPSQLSGSFKDGIGVSANANLPRGNVQTNKPGGSLSFGTVNEKSAPIASPAKETPPSSVKAEPRTVQSFGSIDATAPPSSTAVTTNGKLSTTTNATSTSSTITSATPMNKPKVDISSFFRGTSSTGAPSPVSASFSESVTSPPMRSNTLSPAVPPHPGVHSPNQGPPGQGAFTHPSQPFVPSMRGQQGGGPGGPVPRSPSFQRQLPNTQINGGSNGLSAPGRPPGPPNAGNGPMPTAGGMSSPRLSAPSHQPHQPMHQAHPPHHQQHTAQPVNLPGMQPQMTWNGAYYYPYMHQAGMPPGPGSEHYMSPYVPHWQMHPQAQMHQPQMHPPPPQTPHGMPVSPRQPPPPLQPQPPGTPPAGIASPLPSGRLNTNASAFVPNQSNRQTRIKIKDPSGHEVDFRDLVNKQGTSGASTPGTGPGSSAPSPVSIEKQQNRRAPIRMESEEARQKRMREEEERKRKEKEEEDMRRKEKEEAERKKKEELERKKKEEEELRLKKEEEEKRRKEDERRRKEEEERIAREEKEREEQERLRKEEEEKERIRKEEEEKERLRKEEEEIERIRKEEEEKERLRREEEERAIAKAKEEDEKAKAEPPKSEPQAIPIPVATTKPDITPLSISPESHKRRPIPGPLDLSSANKPGLPQPLPSALATARHIQDLYQVPYPDNIKSPKPELNANAKDGKFRYDREFLLQFMSFCKEKPDNLPPLEAIGLEPVDQSHPIVRGGSGRGHRASGAMGPPSSNVSRQASIGLGFSVPPSGFGKSSSGFAMGNFSTPGKLTSEERFMRSTSVGAGPGGLAFPSGRPSPMVRSTSQGGPGAVPPGSIHKQRTRSKRGEARNESNRLTSQPPHQNTYNNNASQFSNEPVVPLEQSANRWVPLNNKRQQVDENSPEVVDRKVRALLNKLTMENFESISNQIISWANKSVNEKDGRTLIQVIRLVFEKATDEATWSEMYARLCRKMMEKISPDVQDDGIRNSDNKPITGGLLFRKYLLNRCQEDFERGWTAKEATAAAAAAKATEDKAVAEANENLEKKDEAALYSEEYYAAQKAKRQGLGLAKFIGELFKLQMLTERIMHECIKKLLSNVDNPEEEEIESLCKLLITVGQSLDTAKARGHMDVYFKRMKELADSNNVSSRMRYMLLDVIELRDRRWIPRNAAAAPSTLAQVAENALKEKAQAAEKDALGRSNMSRGGSRRGVDRGDGQQVGPDGWAVASGPARPTNKAGDLSNFGKITKGGAMTFGPTSVFTKKDGKRESSSLSRASSSTNMFSMLQNSEVALDAAVPSTSRSSRPPSRTTSVDLGHGAPPSEATPSQRPRLNLLPRSKPVAAETSEKPEGAPSEEDGETGASLSMTKDQAQKKIEQDVKEFFAIRNLEEAEVYFTALPIEHRHLLVDKLVGTAIESKEADAKLVADYFERSISKNLCSPASFEEGFVQTAEIIDDIAIDAPKAFDLLAIMIKGAKLDDERRQRLAGKSMDSEKLLKLLA